jgi:hypothetical protein
VTIEESLLTHDERKAAEAAFRGLPLNARWSQNAQRIYLGICGITRGRDIVGDSDQENETLAVGV